VSEVDVYALNFSAWKRPYVRLSFAGLRVRFVDRIHDVPVGATLAIWGMMPLPGSRPAGVRVVRLEDGFLRSVGLGADLIRPLSWVVDGRGLYYDARQPSDLEVLLQETIFDAGLLERARRLRERIVALGLTKYNVGSETWQRPNRASRVILVPGQVESDASLAFGAPGIRRNIDLLRAVREANPGAYVIYKPHPDVVARLRAAGQDEQAALHWCNEIVVDAPMDKLLAAVDEVHVMTSLAGFEALLRGKAVTCHGLPFYAGWGLTTDLISCPRRSRRLSLDELVAGALLLYPLYFDRRGKRRISPEEALDQLVAWRDKVGTVLPWWRGLFRMVLRRVVGVR
jgi:capsular polysaccharide export protein